MNLTRKFVVIAALAGIVQTASAVPTIFDDFNVNEGHFATAPNFSGTTVGESTSGTPIGNLSTADRDVAGAIEGAAGERLIFAHDGSTTNIRIRLLSGGGTVASNVAFVTSPATDGFIGFYLRTTAQNYTTAINLDGSDGLAGTMDMGVTRTVIGDGAWHLYEWDLDDVDLSWSPVTAIGGDGVLQDGSHTIDSIYFFGGTGTTDQQDPAIFLDFVAKTDSGSVATLLIPEPSCLALVALGALGFMGRRSKRRMA